MKFNKLLLNAYESLRNAEEQFTYASDEFSKSLALAYLDMSIRAAANQQIIITLRQIPINKDICNLMLESGVEKDSSIYRVASTLNSERVDFTLDEIADMLNTVTSYLLSVSPLREDQDEFLLVYNSIPASTRSNYGTTSGTQVGNFVKTHIELFK